MRLSAILCAALFAAVGLSCRADPILYTLSGNFSGTLGNTTFTNAFGTFSETADPSAVTTIAPGYSQNAGSVTFNLAGYAPINFDTTFLGVESEYDAASFYDLDSGFAVGVFSEDIAAYDLTTPIGPVTGFFVSTGPIAEYSSQGYLTITGTTGDLTFTAADVPSTDTAVTPEPPSLLLLSTGLLATVVLFRQTLVRQP